MGAVPELLRGHPEVALFAALSLGFLLGKRKVGTLTTGRSTCRSPTVRQAVLLGRTAVLMVCSAPGEGTGDLGVRRDSWRSTARRRRRGQRQDVLARERPGVRLLQDQHALDHPLVDQRHAEEGVKGVLAASGKCLNRGCRGASSIMKGASTPLTRRPAAPSAGSGHRQ
jgi:hypothetical protein